MVKMLRADYWKWKEQKLKGLLEVSMSMFGPHKQMQVCGKNVNGPC